MIRVHRPPTAPTVLLTRGAAACLRHCQEYDSAPRDYARGIKAFRHDDFDGSIYAHEEVKDALRAAQHDKCAFCESKITHVDYGDVEHFRPKTAFHQQAGDPLRRPGYYWLAYEWTNLFLSCTLCNQQFKGNRFPLRDGRRRVKSHRQAHFLSREQPLLIDPASVDPSLHLEFREHIVYPVGSSREGQTTIKVMGLNREPMAVMREERFDTLSILVKARNRFRSELVVNWNLGDESLLREIEDKLAEYSRDSAEYAAMARAYLAANP